MIWIYGFLLEQSYSVTMSAMLDSLNLQNACFQSEAADEQMVRYKEWLTSVAPFTNMV